MNVMSVLGFDAADLEANQRGHLSSRQYQRLLSRVVRAFADLSHPVRVGRFTGLLAADRHQSSGKRAGDFLVWVGDVEVVLLDCGAVAKEVSAIFEPGRIYTAYCVECDGRKLLVSLEEGPNWLGSTEHTAADR